MFRPALEQFEDRVVPTTIAMPTNLSASRGAIVSVPINVDTLNDQANSNFGLSAGNFVVFFNASVFTVSPADISLGTISTNGSTALGSGYSPSASNTWITSSCHTDER